MICSNCGTRLRSSDQKCPRCGRAVSFEENLEVTHLNLKPITIEPIKIEESKQEEKKEPKREKKLKEKPSKVPNTNHSNKILFIAIGIFLCVALSITGGWMLLSGNEKPEAPKQEEKPPVVEEPPIVEPPVVDDTIIAFGDYEAKKLEGVEYEVKEDRLTYQVGETAIEITVIENPMTTDEEIRVYIQNNLLPGNIIAYAYRVDTYEEKKLNLYNIITGNTKDNYILYCLEENVYAVGMLHVNGSYERNPIPKVDNLPEEVKGVYDTLLTIQKQKTSTDS